MNEQVFIALSVLGLVAILSIVFSSVLIMADLVLFPNAQSEFRRRAWMALSIGFALVVVRALFRIGT